MDRFLADSIALVHAAFIAFVVFGLLLVIAGRFAGWRWVRNPWFRGAHLAAIGFVAAQAWLGADCPLTVWESALRERAGEDGYEYGFIAYWVHRLIFFEAEPWVFTLAYTLFAAAVAATFVWAPPCLGSGRARRHGVQHPSP